MTDALRDGTPEDLIEIVTDGFGLRVVDRVVIEYSCTCSRERVLYALASVGEEGLLEMSRSDGDTEVSCQFCDKLYHFTASEIEELLNTI